MKNFVVDIQGRQLGPFTAAELRAMAAAGSLPHDALIHDRDSGRRMIASSVAGLVFPQASNGHPATGMPPLPAQRRGGGAVDSTRDARGAATRRPAASPPPRRFKSSDITEATAEPYEFESVGDDGPDDLVRVPRPLEWGADLATESPRATKILGSPTQGPLSGRINGRPVLIWISVGATAAVALVIGLLAVVFLWSGSDRSGVLVDTDVRAVQSGRLENCRADGSGFVNCRGGLVYEGKPAIAEFQFRDAGGSISLVSLEIDGQPQSQMTQAALMRRMCGN